MTTQQQGGRLDLGAPVVIEGTRESGTWGYLFDNVAHLGRVFGSRQIRAQVIPTDDGGKFFVDERDIPHDMRPWRPFEKSVAYKPDGTVDEEIAAGRETFYANSHYLVFHRVMQSGDPEVPNGVHLSMRTIENDHRHDWREMQRVKNELVGPDWEAVELYPAEDRVVDSANQYHLWCFPFRLGFGFGKGFVDDTLVHTTGGNQRPLEKEQP